MPLDYRDIARKEERRQAEGTAEVAGTSVPVGGGIMSYAGPGSWANQACGLGLDGPVSDADLDELVSFYVARGVEPRIEVCPFVDDTLLEGLAKRGFELRGFENVLARELPAGEDLRASLPHPWPRALELERVAPDDDARLRQFIEVSSSGFPSALDGGYEIYERIARHAQCDSFLAVVDGAAAGGGTVTSVGDLACLFGASVLPEFRGRGIQAALIVRRLEQARERGCTLAVIHSTPGIPTERNARRLGFFMAYSKAVMAKSGPGLVPSP